MTCDPSTDPSSSATRYRPDPSDGLGGGAHRILDRAGQVLRVGSHHIGYALDHGPTGAAPITSGFKNREAGTAGGPGGLVGQPLGTDAIEGGEDISQMGIAQEIRRFPRRGRWERALFGRVPRAGTGDERCVGTLDVDQRPSEFARPGRASAVGEPVARAGDLFASDISVDFDFVFPHGDSHSGQRVQGLGQGLGRGPHEHKVDVGDRDVVFPNVDSLHTFFVPRRLLRFCRHVKVAPRLWGTSTLCVGDPGIPGPLR